MMVDIGLGLPVLVEHLGGIDRLDLVQEVRVAVVIVTDVLVVEPGKVRALVLGVHGLVVPVGHHDLTVGVEAGEHEVDDVVQNRQGLAVVARRELISVLGRRLRRGDFRRVQPERLAHHGFSVGDQPLDLGFREAARVCQPLIHLANRLEVPVVLGRRDDDEQIGMTFGGRPEIDDPDPLALPVEQSEVFDDLVPPGELPVRAHLVAEEGFGRRDVVGRSRLTGEDAEADESGDECGNDGSRFHDILSLVPGLLIA